MLLAVIGVLWVALLLTGAAIYGVRVRPAAQADEDWPRWVWGSTALAAVLLVVVLPGMAVLYSTGERERTSHSGVELTEAQISGRELFGSACKRCHTLADVSAASTIGPNLDVLQPSFGTVVDAVVNGRARGRGQMPAGLANTQGAKDVASYLEAVAGREGPTR